MEEKNFELEIAPLTDEELDAVDGGAGERHFAITPASSMRTRSPAFPEEQFSALRPTR